MRDALLRSMDTNLLATLRAHFGTVSSQTASSGVVMVRNVTARKKLALLVEPFAATITDETSGAYPRLVTVSEPSATTDTL